MPKNIPTPLQAPDKPVGVWIRVSTEDQAQGDSPEHHEKRVPRPTSRRVCGLLLKMFRAVAVPLAVLTDRGCEFTAGVYRGLLERFGVADIKARPRRPQTNGKMERFFQSLKQEYLRALIIRSPRHLDRLLADYVEFYNRHRPHQALDGLTPEERMTGALWKPPPKDAKIVPRVRRLRLSKNGLLSAYAKVA
jgi:transposase InsO family protein